MSLRGKRNRFNQRLRRELLAILPRCSYCGRWLTFQTSSIDHIVARLWGGSDARENLCLACRPCNRKKDCESASAIVAGVFPHVGLYFVWEVPQLERNVMTLRKVSFDYSVLQDHQARLAKECAADVRERMQRTARDLVEIGRALCKVHSQLREEHYLAWLSAELGLSKQQAHLLELVGERFGSIPCVEFFSNSALQLLSKRIVPAAAIEEAAKLASAGQMVTWKLAQRIAEKHRPRPAGQLGDVGRQPLYRLRSALREIMRLPLAERVTFADELLSWQACLRREMPNQPECVKASERQARGWGTQPDVDPAAAIAGAAPVRQKRIRRREMQVA